MKEAKSYLLATALSLTAFAAESQLTGTKNIPGDYPTLAVAITDLNTQGAGAGGVILNLLAGNPQTAPSGGYTITATGTPGNGITIVGNNNTVTAFTPQVTGALNDAIFKITGGDYITIQGFTLQENASNTTTAIASNNMTEWGVAILYATTTDGAKNITLQNNTISLNRTYTNTFGIYSSNLHTAVAATTLANITASTGANDNLHIYNNTISNVNIGICVVGSQTDVYMATGLDIGGASATTANTLTNYGTTGTFSAYPGVSSSVNGIYVNNNINVNISNNSVTSSTGGTTAGKLRGIFLEATGSLPSNGTITNAINGNTVSIKSGSGTAADSMVAISNSVGNANTTYTINNNVFNNSTHTVSTSAPVVFILARAAALNASINGNTFSSLSLNTTGDVTLIDKSITHPANAVISIDNNSISGTLAKTGAGGTVTGFVSFGSTPSGTESNSGNNFSNVSVTGSTAITLLQNQNAGTASSPFGPDKSINNNSFSFITGGSGAITILSVSGSNNIAANSVNNNSISGVTGTSSILGIGLTISPSNQNIFGNVINGLSTTGGSPVNGMFISSAGATINIYKNKIYDLTSDNVSGTVNGITISTIPSVSLRVYDNLIGDLKTPSASAADAIRGISMTGVTANASMNISYNTIYINATSSGTNFGSSGIFHTISVNPTSAVLILRNNIIVNTSTPKGTGLTVAYRRSSATSLNNYSSLSNNNLFYSGTPASNRLIFYDGTNADQTLAAYKARVSPRDLSSVTESPTFLSTAGASANFLHIDAGVATQIESGGIPIPGINDDYDGNIRNANTPDIGADEISGIPNDLTGPSIAYTPLINTTSTANRILVATITDPSGLATGAGTPLIYYRKGTSGSYFSAIATSVAGNDYTFTIDYTNVAGVSPGDIIQYYIAAQDAPGNVTTVPYGGSGVTPPGSTAPATPNRYGISQSYVWQGGTTDFAVSANWSPARTTPDIADILVFDGSVTVNPTVTNIPSQTITKLVFQNNVNATLNPPTSNTLTLSYGLGQTALDVQSGSTVNFGSTTALTLVHDLSIEGQLGSIAGTLNLNSTSVFTTGTAVTTVTGTLAIKGTATTPVSSTTSSLVFAAGSTLQYEKNGGTIPVASYDAASTVNITGAFTASIAWPTGGIPAGNIIYNSSGSANESTGSVLTTINGTLTVQNTGTGSFSISTVTTGLTTVAGDVILNNGTFNISGSQLSISGSLLQNGGTIRKTSTAAGINWAAANVNQSAGTVDMNNTAGLFTLTATSGSMSFAGTIDGGNSGGISLAFTGSGNQTLSTATVSNKVGIAVNKAGGSCKLLNDLTINNGAAVALTNGKLTVAATKTLTIATGGSITGANNFNYIVTEASGANLGKLKYAGLTTSAQNFSVGTGNYYMPVTITPTTTGSSFAVGVFEGATQDGTPNGPSFSAPVLDNLVNAGWQIDRTVVATPAAITLTWNSALEGAAFAALNGTEIGIQEYNGSGWDIGTGSGDNSANTATSSFSSFSPFIVGKITNSCIAGTTATWMGAIDNDYNKPGNWNTGCVPTGTMNVIIPSGTPTLTGGAASVKNITIAVGATLNLNDGAILNVKGDFVNDGTVVSGGSPDSGKTIFNGSVAQNISGGGIYSHVEIDNAIDVIVITDISVKTIVTLPGAKLTLVTSKILNVLQ